MENVFKEFYNVFHPFANRQSILFRNVDGSHDRFGIRPFVHDDLRALHATDLSISSVPALRWILRSNNSNHIDFDNKTADEKEYSGKCLRRSEHCNSPKFRLKGTKVFSTSLESFGCPRLEKIIGEKIPLEFLFFDTRSRTKQGNRSFYTVWTCWWILEEKITNRESLSVLDDFVLLVP